MAYSLNGYKWGNSQAAGTSGGQVTWSFASGAGSFYAFDGVISDPSFQASVRAAFSRWEAFAFIDFVEVADSASSNIRLGWDAIDGAYNTVGEATVSWMSNIIQHAEIRFDNAETWSLGPSGAAVNFFAVALHEIGHAFGLGHAPDSLMAPIISFDDLTTDDIAGIRQIYGASATEGTESADSYVGDAQDNLYLGRGGNDTLQGLAGSDDLRGGDGEDRLEGGAGADTLRGDNGHDTLFGGDDADTLIGGRDNDSLYGEAGADTLFGEHGDDGLIGGTGADSLYGQDGRDTLWGETGNDRLIGGSNDDTMFGQDGDDVLWGETGHDTIIGGIGNDTAYGQEDYDTIFGENGDDQLYGGVGNDTLYGQADNDVLRGEAGNDFLSGGTGMDQLFGGTGADNFSFSSTSEGTDVIFDFSHAEGDQFLFQGSGFAAPAGFQLTAGIGFISGAGAQAVAQTATAIFDTSTNYLWYDADGTGGAASRSLIAFLPNGPALQADDFTFF